MSKKEEQKNYKNFSDKDLIDLLFDEGDRLSWEAVDEITARGEDMVEFLTPIVKDKYAWERDDDEQWAPIHATFILGAVGGEDSVVPLVSALRIASDNECDWVTEAMPSIFGKVGPIALEALKKIADDKTNDWFVRTIALESLAAITIENPELEKESFDFIASFMNDRGEDIDVCSMAGSILLDFRQKRYRKSLLECACEQEEYEDANFFDEEVVIRDLDSEEKNLYQYTKDWLDFYNPEEIEARQKRWKEENSVMGKIKEKIRHWKFLWDMRKIKKEKERALPQIKLKYFSRDKERPMFGDAVCMICKKTNIYLGGTAQDEETGRQKFICEDCAIEQYKNENHIDSFEVARAQRRRIFDVGYLFKEMVVDKYLAEKNLQSIDNISEKESQRLFLLADETYNNSLSKTQKIILEAMRDQDKIEEELGKIVDKLKIS